MEALKVDLTPEEVKEIREKIEAVEVLGDRYPALLNALSFADTPEL